MGFFDKAKHFMGGHGVKVQHTIIERQDALRTVNLPIGDTVVKGTFHVTSEKPCEVLSMKSSFLAEFIHPDGRVESLTLGEDVFPQANASRSDDMQKYPYTLEAGAQTKDYFLIHVEPDISAQLSKKGWSREKVRFYVRTMVDVKGSPFDPDTRNEVTVV